MHMKREQSLYLQMVYATCCLSFWILCLCSLEVAEGRRLTENNLFPVSVEKRNSWWSKKSLDNMPDYQNEVLLQTDKKDCEDTLAIFKCYSQFCVPEFVSCSRSADDMYNMCKVEHDLCTARCFVTDSASVQR